MSTTSRNPTRCSCTRVGREPSGRTSRSAAGQSAQLGFVRVRVTRWARVARTALPASARPAQLTPYRDNALVDDYVPVVNVTSGDLLRVRVEETTPAEGINLLCVATAAADGTELVPFTTHERSRPPKTKRNGENVVVSPFFFPLGAYRGRVYISCTHGLFNDFHAVWAIDV